MSEQANQHKKTNKKSTRLWVLVGVVLAVPVSVYGINASGLIVSEQKPMTSTAQAPKIAAPQDQATRVRLIQRGEQLQKQQCAGCHAINASGDALAFDQISKSVHEKNADPLAQLVFLIQQHGTATGGSPDAPRLSLTDDERLALAVWILHSPQAEE